MKKLLAALFTISVFSLSLLPAAGASAAAYCGITWGSLPKTAADTSVSIELTNIRVGRHDCYDRMVIDLNGPGTGYSVRYVENVYADGSGQLIPLSGGAKLQIVVVAPSYDTETGRQTYDGRSGQPLPRVNLTGYQTFRSAKFAGSFEGQSTVGLGVRARLPFRVFKLDNRVVIDVAHRW